MTTNNKHLKQRRMRYEAKEPKKRIRSCWRICCLWSSWRLTARNVAIVARDVMHDPWDLDSCRLHA